MNKKFVTNVSWIMIGRIIQLLLAFITAMLVTRYLGPSEYGRLTYVFSYIQLFLPICALGMNDILPKTLLDNREESDKIMGTAIIMRLCVSAVCMVCSVVLVSLFNNNPQYYQIAMLQSLNLLFYSFDSLIYFFQANLLSKKVGISLSITYTLTAIYKIVGILLHKDIMWFAFAMSLDYIIQAVMLLFFYYSNHNKLVFSASWISRLLGKSAYYVFSGLLVVIYGKVTDILLLGKMVDETSVGYYGAAITLCNAWPFVLMAIIDTANPIIIDLYESDKALFEKRLKQLYSAIFYLCLLVSFGIIIFGELAIRIVYGNDFMPAVLPFKIYSFSTAFSYLGVARSAWMQCENKTRYETLIALFGAVVNIVMNYVLIKNYGIIGAAIAAVMTQFLTNYVFLFFIKDIRGNAKLITDAIMLKDIR